MSERDRNSYDLIVAGGGAAGFFAAITCAENSPCKRILILEKANKVLGKVRISGGGRCNVTNACSDPRELIDCYPRGSKQLLGPFYSWGTTDTMAWFEERGVPLKTEADGRVFPQSDDSQSIIDCLNHAVDKAGIRVKKSTEIEGVAKDGNKGFKIAASGGNMMHANHLILTLGGIRNRIGSDIPSGFGHRVEPAAPSLFTFKIKDPRLNDLQGLSVQGARVRTVSGLETMGPVLVTHWGLSGPAILRLSAWGARELQQLDYHFEVSINWCGSISAKEVIDRFKQLRTESPRKSIGQDPQFNVPSRLWKRLVEATGIADNDQWPRLPRQTAELLADQLVDCRFQVRGKSMNKDEFVTCGGVHLDEVNFKTMESRLVPGLHFAGEILDIDGITGGFNFQAAWTTARIAGEAISRSILAT
ncbi:MAG: NAD(P)/FAD-dependent oxidoreductase [Opitutae bacterium]|jgi:predicted Rossmann fold flavoprotein|nr:NAD(P)/FAD-dependent oxidoreductase [Opitutae bacterium]MBT5690057.1 NAD(P)/FAD-dependent oxidoreductase [Opitutae bacterium]MBT6461822.1 NAD(P)/FAD-dependent oxidoreductase [Opitutae bacterium]